MLRNNQPAVHAVQQPDPDDNPLNIVTDYSPLDLKAEQDKDPDLRKVLSWIETGRIEDFRYAKYSLRKYHKQLNRLTVENGILYRNFYDDCGKVAHKQLCLPKHLWKEAVYRIHNSPTGGHLGIVRTAQEFRKRFYFPGFTEHLVHTIKNCLTCLQLKPIAQRQLRPPLQPVASLQSFPGDMLQIDLVGPYKSPVYKYVLTGIDVFSKYLFAVPLTSASADTIARELVKVFFTHSFIPRTILSDLGTSFTSELMHELTALLEIELKHASLKHAQTIGNVERAHAALKRILKLQTNEEWTNWHQYVPLAVFIHNTSYSSSINCCPTSIFHGRDPIKPLNLRFSRKTMESIDAGSDFVKTLQDAMLEKYKDTQQNLITSYHRYRSYYDMKSEAQPLQLHSHCLLLNPKLTEQNDFGSKSMQVWLPLYRVEKVLTNSNYIVRKVGTNYTQWAYRIRL